MFKLTDALIAIAIASIFGALLGLAINFVTVDQKQLQKGIIKSMNLDRR